ncbi:hypothetical protein D3C86_811220 [compost metagenome]
MVEFNNGLHLGLVGEADVVEEAAAQEGVRQLFLIVGGDDDHGTLARLDALPCLVDVELHPIQLQQQIVGKLDVGLVDFVDQQYRPLRGSEGLPQLAAADVMVDVPYPRIPELGVPQPGHRIVFIEPLLGLGGGLDVPADEVGTERLGDRLGQHRLAGARLTFDQQRLLQHYGGIDGHTQ